MNVAHHRNPVLFGSAITSQLPEVLKRPAVLPLPRSGCATTTAPKPAPSVAYHRAMVLALQIRQHGVSPLVAAIRDYADAAFDAAEELRGTAQRIVTAFQLMYTRAGARPGTPLVLSREFASEFLAGERGVGIESDEEALDLRAALVEIVNEGEELEDYREEEQGPGYPREWYPAIADECEWYSDAGWLAICDGEAA